MARKNLSHKRAEGFFTMINTLGRKMILLLRIKEVE